MDNQHPGILKAFDLLGRWAPAYGRLAVGLLFAAGVAAMPGSPVQAQPPGVQWLIAANASPNNAQVQGMAGYVLNAETNINTVYTRKLNQELMNPPSSQQDDGPVIQYEDPPPQAPPSGSLLQAPSQGSGKP